MARHAGTHDTNHIANPHEYCNPALPTTSRGIPPAALGGGGGGGDVHLDLASSALRSENYNFTTGDQAKNFD